MLKFTNASVLGLGFGSACAIGLVLALWIRCAGSRHHSSSSSKHSTAPSKTRPNNNEYDDDDEEQATIHTHGVSHPSPSNRNRNYSTSKRIVSSRPSTTAEVTEGSEDHSYSHHSSPDHGTHSHSRDRGVVRQSSPTSTVEWQTSYSCSSQQEEEKNTSSTTTMQHCNPDGPAVDNLDREQQLQQQELPNHPTTSTTVMTPKKRNFLWRWTTPRSGTPAPSPDGPATVPNTTIHNSNKNNNNNQQYGITLTQLIAMSQEAACTSNVLPPVWQIQHPTNHNNNNTSLLSELSFLALTDDGGSAVSGLSHTGHDSSVVLTGERLDQWVEETVHDIVRSLSEPQSTIVSPNGSSSSAAIPAVDPALLRSTLTHNIRRIMEQTAMMTTTTTVPATTTEGRSTSVPSTTTDTDASLNNNNGNHHHHASTMNPQRLVFVKESDNEVCHC